MPHSVGADKDEASDFKRVIRSHSPIPRNSRPFAGAIARAAGRPAETPCNNAYLTGTGLHPGRSTTLHSGIGDARFTLICPMSDNPSGAVFTRLVEGRTVKLTFVISVVALVLIAGTTTICLSGAVTDRTTEYGSARATFDPMFSHHPKICR